MIEDVDGGETLWKRETALFKASISPQLILEAIIVYT